LERAKVKGLLLHDGDYNAQVVIPPAVHFDLRWWETHIPGASTPLRSGRFDMEILTDASNTGWGAACEGVSTAGHWSLAERALHINVLELRAARLGLQAFASTLDSKQILLRVDNTTALTYINKLGGIQSRSLHEDARKLWQWCEARSLWVQVSYIPSAQNTDSDRASRQPNIDTEWVLFAIAFQLVVQRFGCPTIDLFASASNAQCSRFVSWFPETGAENVDAFTLNWNLFKHFWAFPPFALVLRVLRKIISDSAEGIVLVPDWPNQPWFPLFQELCVSPILVLGPKHDLLLSPCRTIHHPLHRTLRLLVARLSRRTYKKEGSAPPRLT